MSWFFVANNSIDCVILDIELIGGSSFAIADALADNHVPFLFVTGYDDAVSPPAPGKTGNRQALRSQ